MGRPVKKRVLKAAPREPFPIWPLVLLVVTLALFWLLPRSFSGEPVRVEFGEAKGR